MRQVTWALVENDANEFQAVPRDEAFIVLDSKPAKQCEMAINIDHRHIGIGLGVTIY